jgi:hypothetical protein
MDVSQRYCGACHLFHNEMGRELKVSELEEGTVVVLTKEGRDGAMTAWVHIVGLHGVTFYAGELKILGVFFRQGDELHDSEARMHVYQYFGGDAPTSGTAKA